MKGNCEMTLAAVIALIIFATGCGDQGRLRQAPVPSGQSGPADPGNDKPLEHFWFTYRGQPDPVAEMNANSYKFIINHYARESFAA